MSRPFHWEVVLAAECAALGVWLVRPALGWAAVAGVLALTAAVLIWRSHETVPRLLLPVAALAASGFAFFTSWQVRIVENDWPDRRETLIQAASERLDETLGAAVDRARRLAESAADASLLSQTAAFTALQRSVEAGPEQGAVLLDAGGRPWAWAGRHRVDPGLGPAELSSRITPFYVVLEARRQAADFVGVGQVVLAADGAVPDRTGTVAERFARETGARLEFYAPATAPETGDVFDYYIPVEGEAAAGRVDTLFAVRAVPPSQGPFKLQVLETGSRRVAVAFGVMLLGLAVLGSPVGRWLGVGLLGTMLIATPLGARLELQGLFSEAAFFREALAPVTASAGNLLVSAAVLSLLLILVARRPLRVPRWIAVGLAGATVLAAPYVMGFLAAGITPPGDQVRLSLWVAWQVTLAVASVPLLLVPALLIKSVSGWTAPPWTIWAAGAWAAATAFAGILVWDPVMAWPAWYPLIWIPGVLLVVLPHGRIRMFASMALMGGSAAAVLTWGAVVNGRLLLAERDVTRLAGGDPVAIGMLERFSSTLSAAPVPRTAASLYAMWRRSPLSEDDYPAVLATWAPDGRQLARLDLGELELRPALMQLVASDVRGKTFPATEEVFHTPGVVYIVAVPFPDGSVVTAAVGPRSRLIETVRLAQFLRGERRLDAPYTLSLGEPLPEQDLAIESVVWERESWIIRGSRTLELTGGPRHLHAEVELGGAGHHLVRGTLSVAVNVLVIMLLWVIGETLSGTLIIPIGVREILRFRSYRARLTVALAGFFILPTLVFSAWTVGRLRADTRRSSDLVVQQTLSDASQTARRFEALPAGELREQLSELSLALNADLLWYDDGVLVESSPTVLNELGLLNRYMPPRVFRGLARDQINVAADVSVGGQATRIGYRNVGGAPAELVLAAPRLVEVRDVLRDQEDVAFGMALVSLLGLAAAAGLAAVAARSLAKPVQSLRGAALAVGRGVELPEFDPAMPTEFVPVASAFRRMARDVEASQAALNAARNRTVSVLRNVATGVVALDHSLGVTLVNRRAEELLGSTLETGTPIDRLGGPEWASVWSWVKQFVARGEDTGAHEFDVGDRRIRVQVATLHGEQSGAVVALDDATELTRAVRVLAWGELARQIAHEIKNPLTPIRLGVQHLQRVRRDPHSDFDAVLDRTARSILAEIERLDAIARAFARFGAPPAEAAPLAPADLVEIAHDAAELYSLSEGPDVIVEAGETVVVPVRKGEVKEVLINLIENSRDAGASRVTIAVSGNGEGRAAPASIVLADDGRGIPIDDLPHVFEPRFSTTTSGTGLGLAICKRLVESWGGTIAVESVVGQGTVVRITIAGTDDGGAN